MAVTKTRDTTSAAGEEITFTLSAANDELVLELGRNPSAPLSAVNFWIYPNESGNASVKVETKGSGRSDAGWIGIENFGAVTVPTTLSLNTQVRYVRFTSGVSSSTIDVLHLGTVTQIT